MYTFTQFIELAFLTGACTRTLLYSAQRAAVFLLLYVLYNAVSEIDRRICQFRSGDMGEMAAA